MRRVSFCLMNFSKIAILGPGLLGGSIALALRARKADAQIAMWARREDAVVELLREKIADVASTSIDQIVNDAQLVVFCTPIGCMPELAEKIAPLIAPETLVTDVGSVKAPVVDTLAPIFSKRSRFVGSHPMAGSEQSGLAAARADLFENAACILTPDERSDNDAVASIGAFWKFLGCRIHMLPPGEHDEIIARVSHLPHLVAATLVNLAVGENASALDFSGPGFRDTTRVASGPPAMWTEIFEQNRDALEKSINAMIEKLRDVLKLLSAADARAMEQFLTEAKTRRDALKPNKK